MIHGKTLPGDLLGKRSRIPQSWMGNMHRGLGTDLTKSRKGGWLCGKLLIHLRIANRRLGLLIIFGAELISDGSSRAVNHLQELPTRPRQLLAYFGPLRALRLCVRQKTVIHHQTQPGELLGKRSGMPQSWMGNMH
jgi:hypothetical protein